MTLTEIKDAINAGKTVHWANHGYTVIHDTANGGDQWLICCEWNDWCIGLTWLNGVTMNGKPSQFYIA